MFQEIISFGNVPQPSEKQARAAIIPIPLESTVTYGAGTALGPAAIMLASANMELYDEMLQKKTIDEGILTRPALDVNGPIEQIFQRIEVAVETEILANRLPILVGGEHSLTLGALRSLVKHYGTNFTVLNFDAHLDLRESYMGNPNSHACVMKRALDLGLNVRHLGVRSYSFEEACLVKKLKMNPVWAYEVHKKNNWLDKALNDLNGPVYITLDLDGLDPAYMPATGTPEPGGLNWTQLNLWLIEICTHHQVLGLDIVELSPLANQPAWDFTAARLLYRALGLALRYRK